MTTLRRVLLIAVIVTWLVTALAVCKSWAWIGGTPTLIMLNPPQNQTTAYTGSTSGTQESRWFYKSCIVGTNPVTDGLTVTVHLNGGTKTAAGIGNGQYVTDNWDITQWRGTKTAYATAPNANQSDNATMYIKKNRQVAAWVPDYVGCDYISGADGPCSNGFDCSGLQTYLYAKVGYSFGDKTAQGWYTASTHVSSDDALPGDWIFFDWDNEPPSESSIDHTGCYSGVNSSGHRLMTHAANSDRGVVTDDLTTYMTSHSRLYGYMYGSNERF